ncbi:OmpH family outer membrane protein [Acetohalobium arabaticum]|uniref:Outer membrane chaperone Skp (OmpH) n=1 Tax=Acetohalobium arabaticum (strain ATCC 49924 / DSM 5501 / Z-7288) TaxID=574087 RepID=D9QTW3_ACEAZ|nr:OmpH family outer membrane protein [Acetohalobium arabaticum]ADL13684.1 outer membrane chaperone Skp (OmpH) [Acetohalobium arabaticum DSM 5501]
MDKRLKLLLIGLTVLVLATGCAQQDKVAVVNMQEIVKKSSRIQNYQEQLDNKLQNLQTEYESELENIENEEKLEQKRQEAYQESQEIKSKIESKVKKDIQKAIAKVAEDNRIDVVLDQNNVKYGGVDITDKVIETLKN